MRQDQTFGASDVRTYVIYNQTSNIDITLTSLTTTTPQCIEITLTPNTLASNPVIAYDFSFNLFGHPVRSRAIDLIHCRQSAVCKSFVCTL
ncbi:hypothetical protein AHiyo8_59430 [Arthrobacter sp. Hiyo8]|nr:hypothetical protein AHiyo8_59430 [Arthrobacter sp. Hiyo8]